MVKVFWTNTEDKKLLISQLSIPLQQVYWGKSGVRWMCWLAAVGWTSSCWTMCKESPLGTTSNPPAWLSWNGQNHFYWENYSEKVVLLHIKSVCTLEKRKEISFVTKELFTTLIPPAPSFPSPTKISYDKQISDTKASWINHWDYETSFCEG